MRRDSRVDANQPEIVAHARALGASVQHLHTVGGGCTDLVIGYYDQNDMWEVKIPGAKLNDKEKTWHENWKGSKCIIETTEQATERLEWMRRKGLGLSRQTD